MNIVERREHNQYIVNQLMAMRHSIIDALIDYNRKLEVDDFDVCAVQKMKDNNELLKWLKGLKEV